MNTQRLLLDNCAAMMIDIQQKLLPLIENHNHIVSCSAILLKAFEHIALPVAYCEQYPKGLGETVAELKPLLSTTPRFEKYTFSAMDHEEAAAHIRSWNRKNIILFGIEAHVCVLQTALDLLDAGYQPILVVDAIGSRHSVDCETAFLRAQKAGCVLVSTESLLFELIRTAKHSVFKEISQLIK